MAGVGPKAIGFPGGAGYLIADWKSDEEATRHIIERLKVGDGMDSSSMCGKHL
jgi:hypothetical protein